MAFLAVLRFLHVKRLLTVVTLSAEGAFCYFAHVHLSIPAPSGKPDNDTRLALLTWTSWLKITEESAFGFECQVPAYYHVGVDERNHNRQTQKPIFLYFPPYSFGLRLITVIITNYYRNGQFSAKITMYSGKKCRKQPGTRFAPGAPGRPTICE
jgi:hypothetical protein